MLKRHSIDLKLLDEQIKYLGKVKNSNQEERDLCTGLMDMLCDIYSDIEDDTMILLHDSKTKLGVTP